MTNNLPKEIKLKALILKRLIDEIDEKAAIVKDEIQLAIETRDNETKSNVGDKFETTREMMQLEIEKNVLQLNKYDLQKNELLKININKAHHKVELGSFVYTNQVNYFISIGLGKIEIENETVYCISLISPIGKILQNKKPGEKINFQGKEINIMKIV